MLGTQTISHGRMNIHIIGVPGEERENEAEKVTLVTLH